jgi:hypothetical protein
MRLEENWSGRVVYIHNSSLIIRIVEDDGVKLILGGLALSPSAALHKNHWRQEIEKVVFHERYRVKPIRGDYHKNPYLEKSPHTGNFHVKVDHQNRLLFQYFPKSSRYLGLAKKLSDG